MATLNRDRSRSRLARAGARPEAGLLRSAGVPGTEARYVDFVGLLCGAGGAPRPWARVVAVHPSHDPTSLLSRRPAAVTRASIEVWSQGGPGPRPRQERRRAAGASCHRPRPRRAAARWRHWRVVTLSSAEGRRRPSGRRLSGRAAASGWRGRADCLRQARSPPGRGREGPWGRRSGPPGAQARARPLNTVPGPVGRYWEVRTLRGPRSPPQYRLAQMSLLDRETAPGQHPGT